MRTESTDFIHWSEPEVVLTHAFDENDPQSYGMTVTQYEGVYLGLLCSYKKPGNETIDIQLTLSHDNRTWERVAGQATFLPLGEHGSWDDGMLFCAPLIQHDDHVLIYYGGWDGRHNTSQRRAGIGLATLRRDGFVSLNAGAREGVVTTRPLSGASGTLLVNAEARGGSIRVEALGADGNPLPGYTAAECRPLTGDGIEQHVRWEEHDALPEVNGGIRLRFLLRDARLYSFLCDG